MDGETLLTWRRELVSHLLRWGAAEDAEDLASEAVFKCLRGERHGAQVTWGYLYTTGRNLMIDTYRLRDYRGAPVYLSASPPTPAVETSALETVEVAEMLDHFMSDLHPKQRLVFERWLLGWPHAAIAADLHISETASKHILHRARRRLAPLIASLYGVVA